MSRLVAVAALVLAVAFAGASLVALFEGNYFVAGTFLTFVAFAIYLREVSVE